MKSLRDEMDLRDSTRELGNAEDAIERDAFLAKSKQLSEAQESIIDTIQSAVEDINALPQGAQRFGKELGLLRQVKPVMDEASDLLAMGETGAPTIAAETEAIELLLQTKRNNPNGGGGGGGSPGGGSGAARASSAALADIGSGGDASAIVKARQVGQATGRAGREFPEEFKSGLDAYFNNLEGTGGAK